MSYRIEKNKNGEQDLVIDGWEKGIASSPYKGIANIANFNIKYYEGVAYVNYKRQACTMSGGTFGRPGFSAQSPAGLIYISDDNKQIWKQSAVNSTTFNLLTGNANQLIVGLAFWNNYLFNFCSNGTIEICGDGGGDSGVTSGNWNTAVAATGVWPIVSSVNVTLTGTPAAGDTSASISTYTDAQGTARAFWNGPTGFYLGTIAGQTVLTSLTQNSASVTWTPGLNVAASSTNLAVRATPQSGTQSMTLIAANTGDLYFCNGKYVGAFLLNANQVFSKGNMATFTFNANVLALPPTETATWLMELRNQLIVAGVQKLYPWDFFSSFWTNPIPMDEGITKGINILNNLYIFAGNKGNIYTSNGYSISRFAKMPDYISGAIDPSWQVGGIMQHRQKLYFQMIAVNGQSNAAIVQGIFSLDLDTGALNFENQNSTGLIQNSSTFQGLLIDNNSTALNYDNYYSAFKGNAGGVDFNNTTLYSSNEPFIETDIIPIGTFAQPRTFQSMEFKFDVPMKTGDSITVYGRQSLADSYTLIGTTTTAVLSDLYSVFPTQNFQWVQFKVTMSCVSNSTNSSFNRLREIRVR